jgi:hypothetical protein
MSNDLTTQLSPENTHVIFVKNDERYKEPIFKTSLKDATDAGDAIIKANPQAECYVFQIRTTLTGHIHIERKDFNQATKQ